MRFPKSLALILAACLLCGSFVACDSGDKSGETTASTVENVTKMNINLVVKADGETKFEGAVECNGTLKDAIEKLTIMESDYEGNCFDDTNILQNVCGIAAADGKRWSAYYEKLGKDKGAIASISEEGIKTEGKATGLEEGCTVVLVLE